MEAFGNAERCNTRIADSLILIKKSQAPIDESSSLGLKELKNSFMTQFSRIIL